MREMRHETSAIDRCIIDIIKHQNPTTVEELVRIVRTKHSVPEGDILERILQLQSQGKLILREKSSSAPSTMKGYFFSTRAYWYWSIVSLAIATTAFVFAVPESTYPFVYVRYFLGSIFVLWLPGYTFIRALFPKRLPTVTRTEKLSNMERVGLSIGMSLALDSLTGLLLNYTPWGITLAALTLCLFTLTLVFATTAIIREYNSERTAS